MTDGLGAEAIIDFVGEKGAIEDGIAMVRDGGFYYVIGYGENINVPTIDIISREIYFIGNLVGHLQRPAELMTLTAQGKVTLHTTPTRSTRSTTPWPTSTSGASRAAASWSPTRPRRRPHGQDPPLQRRRAPAACRRASTSWPTRSR